jgi:FkbM family methyltransferase
MYSQNNEEKFIVDYFSGHIGVFMDIGGFHPFQLSNTRKLYELGWKGIYLEASLICFDSFVKEYNNDDRITLFNKAVVSNDNNAEKIVLFESNGDAVSTTSPEHVSKWQKSGIIYKPVEVETIKTSKLENLYPVVDFLSIDVESTNFEIFSSFTDSYISNVKMLCIEHDSPIYDITSPTEMQIQNWINNNLEPAKSIYSRVVSLGFNTLHINQENVIFSK